jgi:hypothetical protein
MLSASHGPSLFSDFLEGLDKKGISTHYPYLLCSLATSNEWYAEI